MNDTSNITTTIHIQGEVSSLDKTLEKIEKQLNNIKLPQSLTNGLDERIVKLKQNLKKLMELTANNLVNTKDMAQVNKLIESVDKQFADLSRKLESEGVATAALKKDAKVLESLKKAQDDYTNAIAATQKEQAKLNDALTKAKKAQAAAEEKRGKKIVSDIDYTRTQEVYKEKKKSNKEAISNLSTAREAMEGRMASSNGKYTTTSDPNFHKTKEYRAYAEALKVATKAEKELAAARAEAEKYTTASLNAQEAQQYTEKVQQAQQALDNFNNSQLKANERNAFDNLKKSIQSLPNIDWQEYGIDISTINSVEDLADVLNKVGNVAANNTANGMQVIKQESANLRSSLDTVKQTAKETGEELEKSVSRSETTQGIVNRIKQFVGWTGAAIAFRKVAQDAISTIKELDKQMTEMAVVTDMRVPDYWNQLPQYTQRANELGVSIKAVYEAATLYYQQGLKTNEVVALSNATLKMARIAGLDAADATDKMTAALRGFNMELSDTSATNVADVYSKLAAITAADVEEISTAMTKTASIASSANMEFETTAAFLSQIIETTRESAETAGTALKTVIARFQELKKDPSEIGEVDGEIVDANKIETALRSVGVALRDQQGQFRDLDDVFLELSSKWQGLDTNTQRYIATIAAGSRQQSRFIAMMQDYGRTTELVNAANNAAGASNEQFSKTLDSLESKVERLKNSWHTFTLGLLNNELIKAGIDALNGLLTAINKLTQGWDSFSGGALKLGLVISALYAGDKALKVFTTSLKGNATIFQSFGAVGKSAISGVYNTLLKLKVGFTSTQTIISKYNKVTSQLNGLTVTNTKTATTQLNLQRRQQSLIQELTVAYKMNKQQQDLLNLSLSQGYSIEQSLAIARNKDLLTQYQANVQSGIASGLSQEEAEAKARETLATSLNTFAQNENNVSQGKGLKDKIKDLALRLALRLGIIKETAAKSANNIANTAQAGTEGAITVAKEADTAATVALTTATYSLNIPVLIIIAALLVLIGIIILIIALMKKAKENSPEGQLKKSQEALEKMTKAADAAAESYNNLNDSITELDDEYKALDELTVGTQEWRDAVAEVNSRVMDLINTYPELAAAVENVNGLLEINKQKQEEVLKQKFQEKQLAANIVLAQRQEVTQKQQEVNFAKLSGTTKIGNNPTQGDRYKSETKQLAIAIASGEISMDENTREEEIKNYLKDELGFDDDNNLTKWAEEASTDKAIQELQNLGNSLMNANRQIDAYSEAMAANVASLLEFTDSTQQSIVSNLITGDLFKQYTEKFSDDLDVVTDKELKDNAEYRQYVIDTYGASATIGDSGEIITPDQTIDAKNAREGYAQYKATKELTQVGEDLKEFQEKLNKTQETVLLDKSGKKIKMGDIDSLLNSLSATEEEVLNTEGLSDEVASEIERVYRESILAANQALIKATEKIDAVIGENIEFSGRLTTDAISGLADHLAEVAFISGDGIATGLNDKIKSVLNTLTDSQIDTFMTTLNSIDWTDKSGILNFATSLEEAGLEVTNSMYELQDSIIKATKATYKLNFKDLQEKLNNLGQIINNIRSGEQGRSFSEEDYNTIINALPTQIGNFVKTLDGNYQYIGSSMDNLTEALNDNTNAILKEKLAQLSGSKELNEYLNTEDGESIGDELEGKSAQGLLKTINDIVTAVGGDALESLGIKNFSKDFSKLITLSTDELRQLVDDIIIKGKSYSKSEEEKYINLLATDYQKLSEKGIVASFQGIIEQYNPNDSYMKLQLEGISKAIAANAYAMGLSDTDVSGFQEQINKLLEGSDTEVEVEKINDFLKKFIEEPWKETFGELAQLSNITDYYNNQLSSLQETYEELVDSQTANGKELYNNLAQQQAIYKQLNNTITDNINANNDEIEAYEERYKYLSTVTDSTTGQKMAVLDTEQLGDTSAAVAEKYFEEYKKLIETNNNLQTSQKQNLINIRKNQKKAEEYYNNTISTVRDSLIAQQESQIEALSNINDTINSVSDSIVSGMRDAISEDRQARENAEQLQSIQDKEAQLAYLRATSGSQVEILALQKEIADEQQSYQDSLIDQQLDAMEKANEEAADQRERQINIAQAQFDYWKNNESWSKAKQAVNAAINDPTGELQTKLQNLITATNDNLDPKELSTKLTEFSNGLYFSQSFSEDGFTLGSNTAFNASIVKEMASQLPKAIAKEINESKPGDDGPGSGYKEGEKEKYDEYVSSIDRALTSTKLDEIQNNISNDNQISDKTKQTLTDKVTAAREQFPIRQKEDYEKKIDNIQTIDYAATLASEVTDTFNTQETSYIKEGLLQKIGRKQKDLLKNTVHDTNFLTSRGAPTIKSDGLTDHIVMIKAKSWGKPGTNAQKARVENAQPGQLFIWGGNLHIRGNNPDLGYISKDSAGYDYYYNKLKDTYYDLSWLPYMAFKTGGLANFTGPAWLDGTPSAPELVLNSTDTKNFIQLRDILSEILKPGTTQNTTNNEGDTYIDIDINVDELANDYDVDEVAERVQEIIVRDASYRNVNNVYLNK